MNCQQVEGGCKEGQRKTIGSKGKSLRPMTHDLGLALPLFMQTEFKSQIAPLAI